MEQSFGNSGKREKLINNTDAHVENSSRWGYTQRSEVGEEEDVNGPAPIIVTSPRRFIMLALFALAVFVVNAAERVKLWFRDSSGEFTFLVYMDNVMYIVGFIPAVIIIEKFGMKITLLLSVGMALLGAWIALMVSNKYVQIFGQLIIDTGFPLVASAVTKVPSQWFPYRERFYATSLGILAGMFGYGFGDISIGLYGQDHPIGFALTLTGAGGACMALLIFLYQDKPAEPPSVTQAQKQGQTFDLKPELLSLKNNTGFIMASISAALFITYIVDISKGLANIIRLGDPGIEDINGITIFFYVPGMISVMLPALYLGRGIMMYRSVFCLLMFISFITLGLLVIAIAYANESLGFLYTCTVINGFVTNMAMPLCYEIVTETGHPNSEALTAGFVHALYAFLRLFLKGFNRLLDGQNSGIESFAYCFVLIIIIFVSFVLMFFAKVKHRRLKIETKMDLQQQLH